MIVKVINITTYVGMSGGAEHYYASINEVETTQNVHALIDDMPKYKKNIDYNKLEREITTEKEAKYLRDKDQYNGWRVGKMTERFNSVEEIRKTANKLFPDNNIIFVYDHETSRNVKDIIDKTEYTYIKTGKKLKIGKFTGFSPEFVNLTTGSIHEIIETPDKWKHKTSLRNGYWVMGVTEPVLVLNYECEIL